jgi:hypothetical protein
VNPKTVSARLTTALPALCLLLASPLFATIDGTVSNGTTNQPVAGVALSLVQPGQQGMQTLGTAKSGADGRFSFDLPASKAGPQLVQAVYKGVTYNKLITPGAPTEGISVQVFETVKTPAEARVAQHMIVLEPAERQLAVSESIIVENKSNTTYSNDELGAVRFYLPADATGQVGVSVKGPAGMPLPRSAEKTNKPDVYKVTFPIKPGETEFSINYALPAGDAAKLAGKLVGIDGQPSGPLRLIAPPGVTFESADLRKLGVEPQTQAIIYDVVTPAVYSLAIKGIGSLRGSQEQSGDGAENSDSPQVESNPPPVYKRLPYLAALGFGILAVGFTLLYRSSPVRDL